MSTAITINDLEGRSYAILADASQTISAVAKHSRTAWLHYSVLRHLRSMSTRMTEFLEFLHDETTIAALEAASPQQLDNLTRKMCDIPPKLTDMMGQIRKEDLGYWKPIYRGYLDALESANCRFRGHIESILDAYGPFLLTRRDQEQLLSSLLSPDAPNEALIRAFNR